MKREIEFRGKREDNGEWIYGVLYQEKKPYTKTNEIKEVMIVEYRPDLCLVSGAPDNNHWWRDVIPETVCQFTGLRDKNGIKIYEGDIIEHTISGNISVHEVYFDNEMLEFGLRYSGELFHCQFNDEFELVGNIHDNPELLTK